MRPTMSLDLRFVEPAFIRCDCLRANELILNADQLVFGNISQQGLQQQGSSSRASGSPQTKFLVVATSLITSARFAGNHGPRAKAELKLGAWRTRLTGSPAARKGVGITQDMQRGIPVPFSTIAPAGSGQSIDSSAGGSQRSEPCLTARDIPKSQGKLGI